MWQYETPAEFFRGFTLRAARIRAQAIEVSFFSFLKYNVAPQHKSVLLG